MTSEQRRELLRVFVQCGQAMMVAACLLLALADHARAQESKGSPGYDEAVRQALIELEAQNYPEAREEFGRAHALFPNARTLRGLGMVEFELRNYGECVKLLGQALDSEVKPLDDKLRAETEALLERARRYLGEVHVQTDPSGATVVVDGASMELGAGRSLLLEVGEHTLEVRAPGRNPARRVVQIKGGQRTQLRIALDPIAARDASSVSGKQYDVQPLYKKWWLWTIVGIVAVGAGTTAAVLLARRDETGGSNTIHRLQTLQRF